jgi:hypothetical protein
MGRRRKNRASRPPSTEELLTERVSQLLGAGSITPMMVYDILLMGHRVYKQGVGLPHEAVWKSILDAFRDHDRHYLTPGQTATLYGKKELEIKDMEYLNQ